jgi:hypothetical protein
LRGFPAFVKHRRAAGARLAFDIAQAVCQPYALVQ